MVGVYTRAPSSQTEMEEQQATQSGAPPMQGVPVRLPDIDEMKRKHGDYDTDKAVDNNRFSRHKRDDDSD